MIFELSLQLSHFGLVLEMERRCERVFVAIVVVIVAAAAVVVIVCAVCIV